LIDGRDFFSPVTRVVPPLPLAHNAVSFPQWCIWIHSYVMIMLMVNGFV